MKKYITLLLHLIIAVSALNSCYKDKGNYDYIALDKVVVDTSNRGIKEIYSIERYDTLQIQPKLIINDQEIINLESIKDKYAFSWSIFQITTGGTIYSRDTLSNEFTLDKPITKGSGTWNLVLTVKNLNTQVEAYQKFQVEVSEAISDGWIVLYEKDGYSDVGLIVDERIKLGATRTRVLTDLIKNSNGKSLEGKPVAVLHSATALNSREVLVASEKNIQAYNHTDFTVLFDYTKLFYNAPINRSISGLTTNNSRREVIINNNKIHVANFVLGNALDRSVYFGPSLSGDYGNLAPWNPKFVAQGYDAVAYDATNKKFLYSVSGSMMVNNLPNQSLAAEWNPSDVGLDFVASDYGFPNTPLANEYMIMRNSSNTYLLTANFASPVASAIAQKKYDMTSLPESNHINTMAASSTGAYIVYGASNNLYAYRYQINNVGKVWSAPNGEEITSVKFLKFYHTAVNMVKLTPLGVNQYIYISTYNQTTKEGKVYNLKIDITNGTITSNTQKEYSGFGKIVDMGYKWNL
ncbi:PKD-like family lipoprotein [Sphingobacterium bovistauri]|uniref:PKD-like family protein n=1 Tax=Sphingobacterium bovistauri TaxID=2781959 RepID=A0ABS7Z8P6_9SPHI|nr:PKD-like family lipoprotein [Sphingobacterium bovistauri]MCA5006570.1 hypothetical protein [Sphingobacterium bovistauri]